MPRKRRFVVASAIAVVVTAAFLPGSGFGSSARAVRETPKLPAGLTAAIHARLGAAAISSSSAESAFGDPELGFAVALSADGTTALVGAPGVGGDKGAAYIFHAADAGSWTSRGVPTATLTSKHGAIRGEAGTTVALSADGTTAFVGASSGRECDVAPGAIYVFHASSEGAWSSSSTPTATLTVTHSICLGISLALSADGATLVAGAPMYSAAYVFHVSSEGAWATSSTPSATLSRASKTDVGAGFVVAISADGTTVLVEEDENGTGGGAYVYHVSAADAWASSSTPTAILSDSNGGENNFLGESLAFSGDGTLAFLGAWNAGKGYVDVFHSSGEAAWTSSSTPTATLPPPVGGFQDPVFGPWVAVSADGTTALVTAAGVNSSRGAAYIYRVANEGAWASSSAPTATLTDSGGRANDLLAFGVLSAAGATALVGAPGVKSWTGAAKVFHVADESSWASTSTPNATLADKALAACVVPKLRGLRLHAAERALLVGRCRLGKVTRVQPALRHRGRVLSQSRKPGKRLAIGAEVNVRLGK